MLDSAHERIIKIEGKKKRGKKSLTSFFGGDIGLEKFNTVVILFHKPNREGGEKVCIKPSEMRLV